MLGIVESRNQVGRSIFDLTNITLSEDIELWSQLCRLYLPSKMISFVWRILLNSKRKIEHTYQD